MTVRSISWDQVSALTAVAGVLVATVLGGLAVHIANKTVARSELDYLAARADLVADAGAAITELVGQYKAALHVFWKESLADVPTFWTMANHGPDEKFLVDARVGWLMQARGDGEVRAHEVDYLLIGARASLKARMDALAILDTSEGKTALALVDLCLRSLRLQYATLVHDPKFGSGLSSASLARACFEYVKLNIVESEPLNAEIDTWFAREVPERKKAGEGQDSPEIIAIDFQEQFVDSRWERAQTALTTAVYDLARPTQLKHARQAD